LDEDNKLDRVIMVNDSNPNNLFGTWDRMNTIWFRYWTFYEEKGKTLTGDAIHDHIEKFKREVHFLVRRSCDLEFHQYLNSILDYTKEKGRKDGLVIYKHMRELTRFVLLDKIQKQRGKFLTTRDILSKRNYESEDCQEQLSYGHLHRIVNKYYPELLTTRIELRGRLGKRKYDNDRKIEDHRERIVETQFTIPEKVPPGIFNLVVARAMQKDATPRFLKQMNNLANMMPRFMLSDPIDLAKLVVFRDDVQKLIDEIGENPFIDPDDSEVSDFFESRLFNYLVQTLFHQIRVLVELRWFREKTESFQDKLINREPGYPKYRKKDAQKAISMGLKWFGRPELVIQIMGISSLAYDKLYREKAPKTGLLLFKQCLEQLDLSDEWKAHVTYNLGMAYLQLGQERLMLRRLRESTKLFEKVGGHPGDQADAYGYIAEYWRTKNRDKYLFFRDKSEKLVTSPILTKRRQALHYKYLSDCAYIHQDKNWEKRLYELGLKHSGNDTSLEDYTLWFNQCLGDLEINGERGPERGPGRYPPPEELGSIRYSPSFKATILDPDP